MPLLGAKGTAQRARGGQTCPHESVVRVPEEGVARTSQAGGSSWRLVLPGWVVWMMPEPAGAMRSASPLDRAPRMHRCGRSPCWGRVRTSERDRGLRGGQGRVGETCSGGCSLSGQDRLGMKDLGWPAGSPVCWVEMGFQTEHLRWAVCEAEALRAPG